MKRVLSICLLICMMVSLMLIEVNAAEPIQSAKPISTGTEVSDNLSKSGEVDYFRFTLSKNGAVSVSFSHDYVDSGSWRITLYNSDNEEILGYDCSESPVNKTTDQMGLSAGTYYLKVTEANWRYSNATYRVKVNYSPSDVWETEFNETIQTADDIFPNNVKNGSLITGNDKDYFRIRLSEDGYISITFANEYTDSGSWRVLLYNANNEEITNYTFNSSPLSDTTNKMGLASGTYYLKVETANWNPSSIPYQLTVNFTASSNWESEFNNSMQTANSIKVNTYKYGNLLSYSDVDYYQFAISKTQNISFSFDIETVKTGCWKIELVNANNETVKEYIINGNTSSETTDSTTMPAGKYYVKVSEANWSHSIVPYGLRINSSDSVTPTPTPPSSSFKDVESGSWYADAVQWAVDHKPQITNGTSATTFGPNANCTRAQMVTFLWRAAGEPAPKSLNNPFSDVKPSTYYYKAVLWAVEKGITNGTSKTTFSPEATVTRAQTVTFLWRLEGQPKISTTNPFKDVSTGQYYTDAVLWAVKNGITNGTSETTFSPSNPCTRAQIVTFLYRDMT